MFWRELPNVGKYCAAYDMPWPSRCGRFAVSAVRCMSYLSILKSLNPSNDEFCKVVTGDGQHVDTIYVPLTTPKSTSIVAKPTPTLNTKPAQTPVQAFAVGQDPKPSFAMFKRVAFGDSNICCNLTHGTCVVTNGTTCGADVQPTGTPFGPGPVCSGTIWNCPPYAGSGPI